MDIRKPIANIAGILIPFPKLRRRAKEAMRRFRFRNIFTRRRRYDFVCSIGEACFVATSLKLANLRTASGPFDWMFGSTFEKRFDIFNNKFKNYFDKHDLEKTQTEDPKKAKDTYINKRTDLIYNHDFSYQGDFDAEYPIVREKYDRRIARLMNKIKTGKKVLIVYCEMDNTAPTPIDKIRKILAKTNQIYDGKIDLLYMRHRSAFRPGENKIIERGEHLILGEYRGSFAVHNEENAKHNNKINDSIAEALYFAK